MSHALTAVLTVLALALFFVKPASACSYAPREFALFAPYFSDDTRIEDAQLEIRCDAAELPSCRARARYRVRRSDPSRPTRGVVMMHDGHRLRVRGALSIRHDEDFGALILDVDSDQFVVEAYWHPRFHGSPCVGPGYMARHRTFGDDSTPQAASMHYVLPQGAAPHTIRLNVPSEWGHDAYFFNQNADTIRMFERAREAADAKSSLLDRAEAARKVVDSSIWDGGEGEETWSAEVPPDTGTGRAQFSESALFGFRLTVTLPPEDILSAGPVLGGGWSFDAERPWFRAAWEVAGPTFVVYAAGVETDLTERVLLVPSVELTTSYGRGMGMHAAIFGAGLGLPLDVVNNARVGGRLFASASHLGFGLIGAVDYQPQHKRLGGHVLGALYF